MGNIYKISINTIKNSYYNWWYFQKFPKKNFAQDLCRILASNYTLAAWVNIPSFDFLNASDAAVISIFDSLGLSGDQRSTGDLLGLLGNYNR